MADHAAVAVQAASPVEGVDLDYGVAAPRSGADHLADDLRGQGLAVAVTRAGRRPVPCWVVEATGDDQNEERLEVLGRFYGGTYEREDLTGA